jgi:hypothetical protein
MEAKHDFSALENDSRVCSALGKIYKEMTTNRRSQPCSTEQTLVTGKRKNDVRPTMFSFLHERLSIVSRLKKGERSRNSYYGA